MKSNAAAKSLEFGKRRPDVAMQLSFALYSAANRMARLHKPLLEPMGLTFPQYLVLLELLSASPRSVGEIGAKLGMDTGTITPLLKRLEAGGNVVRRRDRTDERRVLVSLTPAGEALRKPIWAVTEQVKSACELDEDGLAALRDTLDGLAIPPAEGS
jgi:MarR family transcriptional regulator, organic hydroperoxide resistance regulator